MTESQWLAWVRSALRSKWLRWKPRADALKAAQVPYKGSNPRQKYCYKCAMCHNKFSQREVEVDHYPHDAGSILSVNDIGEFCNNLFCETENLRILCKECHSVYTLSQRNGVTLEEAKQAKAVLEIMKWPKRKLLDWIMKEGYNEQECSNAVKRKALVEIILKENQNV